MKYQVEIITKTPKMVVRSHHPLRAITNLFNESWRLNRETNKLEVIKKATYSIRYKVKNLDNGKVFTGELRDFKYSRDEKE